jgi:hypothetical protein
MPDVVSGVKLKQLKADPRDLNKATNEAVVQSPSKPTELRLTGLLITVEKLPLPFPGMEQ